MISNLEKFEKQLKEGQKISKITLKNFIDKDLDISCIDDTEKHRIIMQIDEFDIIISYKEEQSFYFNKDDIVIKNIYKRKIGKEL